MIRTGPRPKHTALATGSALVGPGTALLTAKEALGQVCELA